MDPTDLSPIRQIAILDVAGRLGIQVRGRKAMCFGGHDKRTPSLCFVPSKSIWKCFGCGKGGDAISLVMEVLGCDFSTALGWFAREFCADVRQHDSRRPRTAIGYGTKRQGVAPNLAPIKKHEQSEFATDPEVYEWLMGKCGVVSQIRGLEYLKSHGIPLDVANEFGIRELCDPARALRRMVERWGAGRVFHSGLAWGEGGTPERLIWTSYAILFPFNLSAGVGYIQGRVFKGEPKYLNPRGICKPLYNVDRLAALSPGAVVHICEGVPDAIALEARGLAAVAVLGASSFRAEWVELFMRLDVVLMPDGDRGGETFHQTVSGLFRDRGKAVRSVRLPVGKDVADVLAEMRGRK
jgi:DNA primase